MECFVNMKKKMKMKRKDLDEVSGVEDSPPGTNMEAPPMMEDEDAEIVIPILEPSPGTRHAGRGPVIEELPTSSVSPLSDPVNEERAIVLFKPVNSSPLLQRSPTTMSLSVDPNLIAGFKNYFGKSNLHIDGRAADDDVEAADNTNECKATVPWVPSQFPTTFDPQPEATGSMEDDEMGEAAASMEIEEDIGWTESYNASSLYGEEGKGADSMLKLKWQHCMTPQVPSAPSSPIVWFR